MARRSSTPPQIVLTLAMVIGGVPTSSHAASPEVEVQQPSKEAPASEGADEAVPQAEVETETGAETGAQTEGAEQAAPEGEVQAEGEPSEPAAASEQTQASEASADAAAPLDAPAPIPVQELEEQQRQAAAAAAADDAERGVQAGPVLDRDDYDTDEGFDEVDDDFDPMRDSPAAVSARRWLGAGIAATVTGAVLVGGAIAFSQSAPCDPNAGNNCFTDARNRAAVTMGVPGGLLLLGGIAMTTVGALQKRQLRASVALVPGSYGVVVSGRF